MYIYIYTYISTSVDIYIYTYLGTNVEVCCNMTYVDTRMYVYPHVQVRVYTYAQVQTHVSYT